MSLDLNLLKDDVKKVFWTYLLPSVGGMLGISLYVLGDTLLVGRGLGSSGLAALNLSIPIMNVFSGLGFLLGVGGSTLVSVLSGEGRDGETHAVFSLSCFISLVIGLVITFFGLFYLEEFALFMGGLKSRNSSHVHGLSKAHVWGQFVFYLEQFLYYIFKK